MLSRLQSCPVENQAKRAAVERGGELQREWSFFLLKRYCVARLRFRREAQGRVSSSVERLSPGLVPGIVV